MIVKIRQTGCRWRLATRALALLAVAGLAVEAGAQAPDQGASAAPPRPGIGTHFAQRGRVTLEQAIAIAQRRYRGRVVKAETVMRNGRKVHEVRIINDENRVRTFRIDADSGDSG